MQSIEDVRVWVGAVSRNVVRVGEECAEDGLPVGVIATPNEVSHDGGYLHLTSAHLIGMCATALLGRDHGNHLPSLVRDTENYNIIHVDNNAASALFVETLCVVDPAVMFEVGQEERKEMYGANTIILLLSQLEERLGGDFWRILYAVVQSGMSLGRDRCVGEFNPGQLAAMCTACRKYGVKAKMHNADFMDKDTLRAHIDCGVDAINIGPELAAIQAQIYMREGYPWAGAPSEFRHEFENKGLPAFEDVCGDEIRAAIRARIEEIVEVVS